MGYHFIRYWVSIGLFFYYKTIRVVGLDNIPKDKPVIFLSNHQNALLDVLLIATKCGRKPWFLTRADVFKNSLFRPLFTFLQMIPVYRMRDGKGNLSKNAVVFKKCGHLLNEGESILLFPEANHSLKRRIRPLSKGFTRVIDEALELNSQLDVQLVPIGQNYQFPTQAGDSASVFFGKPIQVQHFMNKGNYVNEMKASVFEEMVQLTTHVEPEEKYDTLATELNRLHIDFTRPKRIKHWLANPKLEEAPVWTSGNNFLFRFLFRMLNFPFIFLWRSIVKPKVPEPEFEGTFRFGFALLIYTSSYFIALLILTNYYDLKTALFYVFGHSALNLLLVKIGVTSSR